MPTYEYRCARSHEFEVFQKMSEAPVSECPECGAAAERVLSGGAGVLFKGEGFYITDYRSEEYRKKASAEKEKKEGQAEGEKGGKKGDGSAGDAGSGSGGAADRASASGSDTAS